MRYEWHLGTESGEYYTGPVFSNAVARDLQLEDERHAYEPHLSYAGECRYCERPEAVHHSAYQVAKYLGLLADAYHFASPIVLADADKVWQRMSPSARTLAMGVLALTGAEPWVGSVDRLWKLEPEDLR